MGALLILNGSPRAPRSNSKQYTALFSNYCRQQTEYREISKSNHLELCQLMEEFSDVVLVFPLYADSLPVTLLNFLKTLEANPPQHKPTLSVIINCGFLEPRQNDIAVEMLRQYCRVTGFPFGSVLKIGSGEAILTTPFRIFLKAKMKKLAAAIDAHKSETLQVTMPISKGMFLRASTVYWSNYGKRNGITREAMKTMDIERP